MNLPPDLHKALGASILSRQPLGGGHVGQAWALDLSDGRRVFLKTHSAPPPGLFETEARGLAWLAAPGAISVPEVLAHGPDFIALAYVAPAEPGPRTHEQLGRGLAAVHRAGPPGFGLGHDNFIGPLPQSNTPSQDWPSFYAARRVAPSAARCGAALPAGLRRRVDDLCARMADFTGPPEPPARLHGDLWGGNWLADAQGRPWIFDPAAYGGHREVDLAMMQLFGGFPDRVFSAYQEVWPLSQGWQGRLPLYQLFYLLVHLELFGSSYLSRVSDALDSIGV